MTHLILPSPKAVLFDWDNTLVIHWEAGLYAINFVRTHYGLPTLTIEQMKNTPARSLRETFPIMFGDEWIHAAKIYYQAYQDVHLQLIKPHENSEDLLVYFHRRGLYLGVVSNKFGDNLRLEVTHLGWDKYFQKIVGSRDTAFDKPSHIPVELAIQDLDHGLGKHIWFIGDSEVDMTTASQANLTGIYVGIEKNLVKIQTSHPETIGFNNLLEIIKYLEENPTILAP
jgi:phosphoglycolate phosphatase